MDSSRKWRWLAVSLVQQEPKKRPSKNQTEMADKIKPILHQNHSFAEHIRKIEHRIVLCQLHQQELKPNWGIIEWGFNCAEQWQ